MRNYYLRSGCSKASELLSSGRVALLKENNMLKQLFLKLIMWMSRLMVIYIKQGNSLLFRPDHLVNGIVKPEKRGGGRGWFQSNPCLHTIADDFSSI
jgi:hypothetical protein